MALPDLAAIRAGIAANLETCAQPIRVHDFYPDAVDGPAVVVDIPDIVEQSTPGPCYRLRVEVVLFVSDTWDRASQKKLNELVGPIITALESDRTADGSVNSLFLVTPFIGSRDLNVGGNDYVGGTFTVEVIT